MDKPVVAKKKRTKHEEITWPVKVGIVYSAVRREDFPTEAQYITEKEAEQDAQIIAGYLGAMGMRVCLSPGDDRLAERLHQERPDMVFNLVDSVKGKESLAAAVPGVLELLGIPYTGADMLGMALDTNKFFIKEMLQRNGLPVPMFQLFTSPDDYMNPALRFPLISKLNAIHGSVEITAAAVSENEKQLRKRLRKLIKTYKQPVLVEEFVGKREITAILLEGGRKKVYLAEKVFRQTGSPYVFLTFEDQWLSAANSAFYYKPYRDPVLRKMVLRAFDVANMSDYGKFDVRLDEAGRYYFIDSNCNPAMGPKELDMALAVIMDMNGVSFYEVLKRLVLNTAPDSHPRLQTAGAVAGKRLVLQPTEAGHPERNAGG
jgi:D-alanine-D-alanine ligase